MTHELETYDPTAADVIGLAEQYLDLALAALIDAATRMMHPDEGREDEVQRAALEVVAALRMLFVLRARISDDRRFAGPAGGSPRIDVDDARDSIGSLLDRLRLEDDSDEVSE